MNQQPSMLLPNPLAVEEVLGRDGRISYVYVIRQNTNGHIYCGISHGPFGEKLNIHELQYRIIPVDLYYPPYDPRVKIFRGRLNASHYVKKPCVARWNPEPSFGDYLAQMFLDEGITMSNVLSRYPFNNLQKFHGAIVENGRITGYVLDKYSMALDEYIYQYGKTKANKRQRKQFAKDIQLALQNLHSLGYVHNDISPANIMLRSDKSLVIIDFDSCRPNKTHLGLKGGTPGFFRPETRDSEYMNDWYSFVKIKEYLGLEKQSLKKCISKKIRKCFCLC